MNYSITIAGALASFIAFLAKMTNTELPYTTEQINNALLTIIGIGGFLITVYGRYRHGDLKWNGFKKTVQDKLENFLN